MTVIVHVMLHDQALHLNAIGFIGWTKAAGFARRRHAIVSDQRVREKKDLAAIGRVGECFDIARHTGVEHDLPTNRLDGTEGPTLQLDTILKH